MDAKTLHHCLEYVASGACEVYVVSREYVNHIYYMGRSLIVVANSSKDQEEGSHWVVFFIYYSDDGIVSDFYDSLSRPPSYYLIDHPYPVVHYNRKAHQSSSSPSCSLFVIYFTYHRLFKPPFRRAISYFSKNLDRNEELVARFYDNIKEKVAQFPNTNTVCQSFGCYPKSNDSLKRRYEF